MGFSDHDLTNAQHIIMDQIKSIPLLTRSSRSVILNSQIMPLDCKSSREIATLKARNESSTESKQLLFLFFHPAAAI
jgi:hypothetical protein